MDSHYCLLLLITSLLSVLLFVYILTSSSFRSIHKHKKISNISPPPIHVHDFRPYPILGHLPPFLKNRHRFHDWMTEVLTVSPTYTVTLHRPPNIHGIITADPANIQHILKSNFDNYPKGPRFSSLLEDFLGSGIFNSDGHQWKFQRKTASFEFNTRSLRNFVVQSVQMETATRLVPLLKRSADSQQVIDIQDVLERYAFDNVCKVAFNVDPACLGHEDMQSSSTFADAFRDAAELSAGRFRYALPGFWKFKKLFGIGSERRLKESINTVHEFATKIIRSRIKEMQISSSSSSSSSCNEPQADDLLSRFIIANENYSEEFLRDIVISFILAGRETTSSALTWFFWLLSSRPQVQNKILEELSSIRARSGYHDNKMFEFDELREMQYLHAAITESMRLYPPVPTNSTACQEDEVLPDGTEIKKGWFMSYHSYAMGRMKKIWGKDCCEYKPERWLDDSGMFRPESPFKFVIFHAGPRMCLGKEMAYIQMKSIIACVIERFVVQVVEKDSCPEQMLSITLRMRGGLPVRIRDRASSISSIS